MLVKAYEKARDMFIDEVNSFNEQFSNDEKDARTKLFLVKESAEIALQHEYGLREDGIKPEDVRGAGKPTFLDEIKVEARKKYNIYITVKDGKIYTSFNKAVSEEHIKKWSEKEQMWFEIKEQMEEALNGMAPGNTKEQKRERAKEIGVRFDKHFKAQTGVTVGDFVKANPSYWTFTEMAIHKTTGEKTRQKKPRIEVVKVDSKDRDVYTDRILNSLIPGNNIEVSGNLTYKVRWIHDVASELIWRHIEAKGLEKRNEALFEAKDMAELTNQITELDQKKLPQISFTEKDVRDIIGRKELLNEDIEKLVKDYSKIHLYGEIAGYWNEEKKTYEKLIVESNLFGVVVEKTELQSSRAKRPLNKYTLVWGMWGVILLSNHLQHKISGKDKPFYRLPGADQNLVRYIEQQDKKKVIKLKQSTAINLMGLNPNAQKRQQKALIIKHLDRLVDEGRIRKVEVEEKTAKEPVFIIKR